MASRDDIINDQRDLHPKGDEEVAVIVDDPEADGFRWGVDDVQEPIKKTFGDFLNCITQEAGNAYIVDPGSSEVTTHDPDGNPATFVDGGGNSQKFSSDLSSWVHNFLDTRAESIKTADYLAKGKTGESEKSAGNSLLSGITSPESLLESGKITTTSPSDGQTQAEQQISQVLRSNRFNPTPDSTPYVSEGEVPEIAAILRDTLGVSDGGVEISYDDLAKHALSLMLMATGDDDGSNDPDNVTGLTPSFVQIGTSRLQRSQLSTREGFALKDVDRTSLPSDVNDDGGDPDFYSYGQLNSHVEPFDGFLPISMVSLAALLTTTTIVSAEVIFGLLALIVNTDGKGVRLDPGPYVLGQYGRPEADGLLSTLIGPRALGLVHTENDFFDAARRGANIFFGFSGDDLANAAENALLNVISSPGYYVVTVRNILRSLNTVSNSLADIDFSNPVSGAQAVLGMVDVIRSSKIIAFFNISAALGDIVINQELRGFAAEPGQKNVVSYVDSLPDEPSTRVMKSRSKTGFSQMSLAWRSSASPAMYLLPHSLLSAGIDMGGNVRPTEALLADYQADKFKFQKQNRISPDDVKELEDALEAEYVPFYFHDLRTNEIVSFHAFLSSLNDNYSANYETVDAYGRVDPVHMYRNTERSIDLSFHVASTSEDDFDEMWWKINKLVTLLYPQWSPGRSMQNDDTGERFRQPFSQIPTASPVIRMRIGDVIKSNYSKFNLSRLFGLGRDDFAADSSFTPTNVEALEDALEKARDTVARMSTDPDTSDSTEDGFQPNEIAILRPTRGGYYLEATPAGNVLAQAASILSEGSARRKVRLQRETSVIIVSSEQKQIDRTKLNFDGSAKTTYTVEFLDDVPGLTDQSSPLTQVEVTHTDLRIDPEQVMQTAGVYDVFSLDDFSTSAQGVSDFFSTENNVVVKAFESSRGRGLAGVIKNMSFDWHTPTWETYGAGRRAPQWCEINVSFAPIHDIPPGLDSDGFNRAPNYNVGRIVNKVFGDVYDSDDRDAIDDVIKEIMLKLTTYFSNVQEV